jgi:hypothetical protein
MGRVGAWLGTGPRKLLDSHGRVVGAATLALFGAVVVGAVWIDRDRPALASGAPGQTATWSFTQDASTGTQVLAGDWVADERGICRVNLEHPRPGSEKLGLLQLAPGNLYGLEGSPYTIEVRYFEERPPQTQGTEMDAGIAIGIRDAKNFGLMEQSALHDVLRLDSYVHGKRRDLREKLVRTHGNEWHTLRVDVSGTAITGSVDDEPIFSVDDASDAVGGIGLWARAAAATCFSDARVSVGGAAAAVAYADGGAN